MKIQAVDVLVMAPSFIEEVMEESRNVGVDLSPFVIDHFCFRVETQEQYSFYKKDFDSLGKLLSEAIISGRPISTYKLNKPLQVFNKIVPCIEIPAPKDGAPYPLGLEHIECVVPEPLTVFMQRFPQLKFNLGALKNPINPEIALKLPSGRSVKFHNQTLEQVIEIEKKLGL
ncbi:MAG: VOC family protein [Bdellovibrionota bacterium]